MKPSYRLKYNRCFPCDIPFMFLQPFFLPFMCRKLIIGYFQLHLYNYSLLYLKLWFFSMISFFINKITLFSHPESPSVLWIYTWIFILWFSVLLFLVFNFIFHLFVINNVWLFGKVITYSVDPYSSLLLSFKLVGKDYL